MSLESTVLELATLRTQPQWKLLAADNAPIILAILEDRFGDREQAQPSAKFHADVKEALDDLQQRGHDCPRTAQEYVATWLSNGWLTRTFPDGAAEEEYAPSAAGLSVLRFVTGTRAPKPSATASRLSTVVDRAKQLVADTDTNQATRLERLERDRAALDQEIAMVEQGAFRVLPDARAVEAARDLIQLAEGITGDFHRVQEAFAELNRQIRTELLTNDENRGEILTAMFASMDVLAQTDEGRSFDAFWEILSPHSAHRDSLRDTLLTLSERAFTAGLLAEERRFLTRLMPTLLQESNTVLQMRGHFSGTLRDFVQSKAFLETRRMQVVLREAMSAATALAPHVRFNEAIGYDLDLSSAQLRSVSQHVLYDPNTALTTTDMRTAEPPNVEIADLLALLGDADVNWGLLRSTLITALSGGATRSIREILEQHEATQGVATVVGYLVLAETYKAHRTDGIRDVVRWTDRSGRTRTASIPMYLFLPETLEVLRAG